jgi:hypothetical protein
MTEEDFIASSNSADHVFDFMINSSISNFTLTLAGSVAFVPESSPPPPFSYGAFTCASLPNPTGSPTDNPQCGPDPTSQLAGGSPTLSADGKTVTFDVTGTNNDFVFFVVAPEPVSTATAFNADSITEPTVTATITSNTTTTPEPKSLPILAAALVAVIALNGRRLANLRSSR